MKLMKHFFVVQCNSRPLASQASGNLYFFRMLVYTNMFSGTPVAHVIFSLVFIVVACVGLCRPCNMFQPAVKAVSAEIAVSIEG